jgi:thymidylate synthase
MGSDAEFGPVHHIGVFEELSDAWLACLHAVVRKGRDTWDGGQRIKELLNVTLAARNCDEGRLKSAGADAVRIGFMRDKYESLEILPQYRMSYGRLFRDHAGVDQVAWVTRRLRENPESKSATIGFHVPGADDLSCISLLDCKLRDGLLNVNAVFRSQNVYGSQPGNAVAISRLRHEIAEDLGVGPGFLTLHILSAHIYAEDLHHASRILGLPPQVVQ